MKRAGFTLIELMIGLTIMVGVLGAAYMTLAAGYESREAVERRALVLQEARVTLRLITADLRVATPLSVDDVFTGLSREVDGVELDNLDFATHNFRPTRPGEGDLCEVSYFVDRAEPGGPRCLFRRRDARMDRELFAGGSRELIATGIAHFKVQYYDGYEWHDEWGERETADLRAAAAQDPSDPDRLDPETGEPAAAPFIPTGIPAAVKISIGFETASWVRTSEASLRASEVKSTHRPLVFTTIVRIELADRPQQLGGGGGVSADGSSWGDGSLSPEEMMAPNGDEGGG
ncbi:MAG: type II secretion system protein J [Planctomycetota bacterium]